MKRFIKIDDRLLEAAKMTLGADTYKDAVNHALERVVREFACERTAAALRAFADATTDLADPEVMDAAWR